jgi:hypothetical protein
LSNKEAGDFFDITVSLLKEGLHSGRVFLSKQLENYVKTSR